MSNFPSYTEEENITRIRMEKNVIFVVVEGIDDIPIYECTLNSLLPPEVKNIWDIVHVGGKTNIKTLIQECSNSNYICVADKDFDEKIQDERVVLLSRYSIENFLICEEAISAALSISLQKKINDVKEKFSLSDFYGEIEANAVNLLKSLFYYQRVISPGIEGEKPSWSDQSIHAHPPKWGICPASVNSLIAQLIPADVTSDMIDRYYEEHFESSGNISHDLPGKMLKVVLQRYVQNFYKTFKKGGSPYSSPDSFASSIIGVLNKSTDFVNQIRPIVNFILHDASNERHGAA